MLRQLARAQSFGRASHAHFIRMRGGYLSFTVEGRNVVAHRYVWHFFKGEIPKGYVVDHVNSLRDDNRLENLKAVTRSENMRKKRKGVMLKGLPITLHEEALRLEMIERDAELEKESAEKRAWLTCLYGENYRDVIVSLMRAGHKLGDLV